MPLILSPHKPPPDLRGRLAALRQQMRRAATVHGGSAVAALALATFIVIGFLDYHLKMPALIRAIALLSLLVGVGLLIRRLFLRPWLESRNDLTLALHVESHFPALNDALGSAIAFERLQGDWAGSPELRQETRRRATRAAEDCDFQDLIDSRGPRRALFGFVAAALAALTMLALYPEAALTAVVRLADPFGAHPWPLQTRLQLEAPTWIARGEPFLLRGELHGVIPDRVGFAFALEGAPPAEQPLAITPADDGSAAVSLRLDANRIPRTFRYQVKANDAVTEWRTVKVVPPPQLVPIDGRPSPLVRLDFPTYTDLHALDLPDGGGHIEGVTGTLVTLRAAVDRPVIRAWVQLATDPPRQVIPPALFGFAGTGAVDAAGLNLAGRLAWQRVPAGLDDTGTRMFFAFRPAIGGRYVLAFEDEQGIIGHRPLDVRVLADPPPGATVERPSASRDSLAVLPNATVTLLAKVDDPVFAVRSAHLHYRAGKDEPVQRLPLYDYQVIGAAIPHLLAPGMPALRLRPTVVQPERRLELATLHHADGKPLVDGDTVILQVVADDFDDVTAPKPPGRSQEVELKIVSPSALQTVVQKAESDIQKELRELHSLQSDARLRAQEANEQRRAVGKLRPDDQDRLVQAEQMQQQLRQRLGDEREGLRSAVDRLRQTLRDNPLPRPQEGRLDNVANELNRLAKEEVPQIEPNLAAARKERNEVPPDARRTGPLPNALEHQRETQRTLNELLDQLKPWSDARELRAEVGMLLRELERLSQQRAQLQARAGTQGKRPEELSQADREELNRLREQQSALNDRSNDLVQRLDQKTREKEEAAKDREAEAGKKDQQAADRTKTDDGQPPADAAQREAQSLRQQAAEARDEANALRQEAEALRAARDLARAGVEQARRDQSQANNQAGQQNRDQSQGKGQTGEQDRGKSQSKGQSGRPESGKDSSQSKGQSGSQDSGKDSSQSKGQAGSQSKGQSGRQESGKNSQQSKGRAGRQDQKSGSQAKGSQDQSKAGGQQEQSPQPGEQSQQQPGSEQSRPLAEQMQNAARQIGENKLGDAEQSQKAAADTLKKMQDKLAEQADRADDAERLSKRLRGLEQELDSLAEDQERLQREMENARNIQDPAERKQELERLAREQEKLQQRAREMAQRLSRQRNEEGAREMRRASRSMEQAREQMEQGETDRARQDQEDALDRIDDAQEQVARARREAEERLEREQQARMAEIVKGLRERQEGLNTESERILQVVKQKGDWDRVLQKSVIDLSDSQEALSREVRGLIEKQFKDDKVITHAVGDAADAMIEVEDAIKQMREDGFRFEQLDEDKSAVQAPQKLALRRLDQLLDALKPDPRQARNQRQQRQRQQGQQGEGGDEGGGGGGGGDGVPPLAELKLLRSLQADLNERTEEFSKKYPDAQNLTEPQKTKLDKLRRTQSDLAALLDEMSQPGDPEPPPGPEARDKAGPAQKDKPEGRN